MNTLKKWDVLGTRFSLLSYSDVMAQVMTWKKNSNKHFITMTPPHSVLLCHVDQELQRATREAALTLPDGVGIILASRLLDYPHKGRVTGPMLMLKLCDWGCKYKLRHYFYGGSISVADTLADKLSAKFPSLLVAGTYSPPFRKLTPNENAEVIERINTSQPDIVWVGLGSPKQEKWIASHIEKINTTALIGVGAAFDFHSGNVKWAPAWIRKFGVEWAYRLVKEPGRMWRRNVNSIIFLTKVIGQRVFSTNGQSISLPLTEEQT